MTTRWAEGKVTGGLYLSVDSAWRTPRALFDALDAEFGFTLDVCATPGHELCESFYTPDDDGLSKPWSGVCWMNPPYGKAIVAWVRRAAEAQAEGVTTVALIPARTDTAWFHDWVLPFAALRFVRGRIAFQGRYEPFKSGRRFGRNVAPFPSLVAVYQGRIAA